MASELIADAITDYFGERCLDYAEGCPTCEAWAEYDRWNTRPAPAATDTGLVTVGWLWEYAQYRTDDRGYYGYETVITENNPTDHVSPAEKLRNVRELVTRSRAEELLAAERAEHDNTIATLTSLIADNAALVHDLNRIKDHETELVNDNAALTARIKELENVQSRDGEMWVRQSVVKALEAKLETYHEEYENRKEGYEKTIDSLVEKLAAAKKVFEFFTDASFDDALVKYQEFQDRAAKARAVLGGKPS